MNQLLVPRRFCGPPSSGNGGWTAGALAGLVEHHRSADRTDAWPAIEVSLRRPPPLDTVLVVDVSEGLTMASLDGAQVDTLPVVARAEHVWIAIDPKDFA